MKTPQEMSQGELFEFVLEEGGNGYEEIESSVVDTWRWGTVHIGVFRRIGTDTHWAIRYSVHTTDGVQANTFSAHRVEKRERTVTVWERVEAAEASHV